jgi:hypothetical protein
VNTELDLAVGDTIQLDGGLHIVEAVGAKTADALPLDKKHKAKPRTVTTPFPRHLIIERGGQAALDKFKASLAEPKQKPGTVRLEPGDRLCHGGEIRTVMLVAGERCSIGNLEGQTFIEDRVVNEFLLTECCSHKFVRLNAEERAANLKQFLAQRQSPLPEAETTSDNPNTPMKTKKSTRTRAAASKTPRKRSKTPAAPKGAETTKSGSKASPAPANDNPKKLFGSSIVRVAMTAGAKGGTLESFVACLKKHGLSAKESTIKANMRHGKNGMKGADLSAEQLKELGL